MNFEVKCKGDALAYTFFSLVIEMAMVAIVTIQIIQVVPTGIHMTVMVRYWFSVFVYRQLEFLGS